MVDPIDQFESRMNAKLHAFRDEINQDIGRLEQHLAERREDVERRQKWAQERMAEIDLIEGN